VSLPTRLLCFFFQAEDGIRDRNVTGVQTCALPICQNELSAIQEVAHSLSIPVASIVGLTDIITYLEGGSQQQQLGAMQDYRKQRSEERRVGKESRTRKTHEA